jgi:hypothetical protein
MAKVTICIDSYDRFQFTDDFTNFYQTIKSYCGKYYFDNEAIMPFILNKIFEKIFKNKYCFLKLPCEEYGFIYLNCLLENNNLYYNNKFVISYDDMKDYILEKNYFDKEGICDYGHFYVEPKEKYEIEENLHESYTKCILHKKVIYFDDVEIRDADIAFYIYKN